MQLWKKGYSGVCKASHDSSSLSGCSIILYLIVKMKVEANKTSRSSVVDKMELVKSLIASASHYVELISSHGTNDDITDDDYSFCVSQIERTVTMRREVMLSLSEEFDTDKKYWCLLKHHAEIVQFATEVWQADMSNDMTYGHFLEANEMFYETLSKYLKLPEITSCGRCFNDMVTEEAKEVDIPEGYAPEITPLNEDWSENTYN